jgi:hypothetical protein
MSLPLVADRWLLVLDEINRRATKNQQIVTSNPKGTARIQSCQSLFHRIILPV